MKKLFCTLLSLMVLNSCNDILDKQPLDITSDATLWNDKVLTDNYLSQCYAEMMFYFESSHGSVFGDWNRSLMYLVTNSDEAFSSWVETPRSNAITINGGLYEGWGYSTIRSLNIFIEKLETVKFDEAFIKQRTAEAKYLRAFAYFNMVKRYGGVPLITRVQQLSDSNDELYPKRSKEAEVYDFILSELDPIISTLPETYGSNDAGRPTRFAAMALKSRAAMYAASIATWGTVQLDGLIGIPKERAAGYWKICYDTSKQIIDSGRFRLYNKYPADKVKNFRSLFLDEDNNSEVIFSEKFTGQAGKGHSFDMWNVPRVYHIWGGGQEVSLYLEMVESFENTDGTTGIIDRAKIASGYLWTLDELFGKKDPRFKASVYTQGTPWKWTKGVVPLDYHDGILSPNGLLTSGAYKGVLTAGANVTTWSTLTPFGMLKYLDEEERSIVHGVNYSDTDYIVFRLGEIYLNYAEAAMELGNVKDALTAINAIRTRAGMPELTSVTQDIIRKERKVELAFEGNRYFDVRRWRTAVKDLTGNFHGLRFILDGNSYNEGAYNAQTAKYKLELREHLMGTIDPYFLERNYYLPIGLSRTSNNPNLLENPGYQ